MRLFLFLLCSFSVCHAFAIQWVGVQEKHQLELQKLLPSITKDFPRLSVVDQAVKLLSEKKEYQYSKATKANGIITITAFPAKKLHSLKFSGNKNISTQQLVKVSKLKLGSEFSRQDISKAVARIKKFYVKQSYLNTFIEIKVKPISSRRKKFTISFLIKENELCRIKEILFLSENKVLNQSLEKYLKKYKNDPLNEQKLEKIQSKVMSYLKKKQYYFSDLEATTPEYSDNRQLATLYFKLNNTYKYEFYYEGNDRVTRAQLTEKLQGLYDNNWSTDPVNKIVENIRNLYNEKGFIKAKINLEPKTLKKAFIKRLTFKINEGRRVRIEELKFGGRFSASENDYVKFIYANSPLPLSKNYYTPESLDKGIANLIANMKNTGYLHAKHISTRIKYIKDYNISITIIINEGPTTNINSIKVTGNKLITDTEIRNQIVFTKDSQLNLKDFEASLDRISKYYYSLGFIEMTFGNKKKFINYSKNNTSADINYFINEGPQIRVNRIQIEGNDFTEDYVVLREIQLKVGDILAADKILRAQTNLTRLGIFSSVDIRTSDANSDLSDRTLLITVTERNPGLLKVGVGASNDRGLSLRGYTGASYNNLFGTARAIYARADAQTRFEQEDSLDKVWKVTAGYVEPYLFNTLIRGRIKTEIERDIIGSGSTLKTTSNRRISLLLENNLSRRLKAVWTLWSLDSQTQELQNPSSTQTSGEQKVDVAIIGPSLTYDSRDNPFLPTKGIYSKLDLQYSSPELGASNEAHFLKTEGNITTYIQLFSPSFIWANSLRGGYISKVGNFNGGGIPEDNLFFLGGQTTIRGFGGTSTLERLPSSAEFPRDQQLIVTDYAHYSLFKSELRFPIYGNSGGVLFWDAGQVIVGGYHFEQPLRQSFGIGYRYNTPVGPLVIDLAFKDQTVFDGEKAVRLHISIGTF